MDDDREAANKEKGKSSLFSPQLFLPWTTNSSTRQERKRETSILPIFPSLLFFLSSSSFSPLSTRWQWILNESIHLFLIQIFLIYRIFVKEYFVESKRSIRWAADMRHNLPFVPVSTDHLNPSSSSSSSSLSSLSMCSSSSSLPHYISVFCWSRSKTGANNTTCPAF